MGKATFMKGKMLAKALHAVEAGWIPEQIWMKSAKRVEVVAPATRAKRRTKEPEDDYIATYLDRHPETEFIALDIASKDHPARVFANRQMAALRDFQLSNNQPARRLARGIVEAELGLEAKLKDECMNHERRMAIQDGRRPPPMKRSVLQEVHEEEMKHHLAGLRKMKKQYEVAATECTIPFTEAFPEARRWEERDQGGALDYFGGKFGPPRA